MRKVLKYLLFAIVVAGFAALTALLCGFAANSRRGISCKGLEVSFQNSRSFVSEQDVKDYLKNYYGPYIGERIDSMNLDRMESVLDRRSAIKKSQAWTTDDGILHIGISQRDPVVRFQKSSSNGFYADDRGFIFPLQKAYTPLVPVVSGKIPLSASAGYKGEPANEAERAWMDGILALLDYVKGSRQWSEGISEIRVAENGDLVLIPREGRERFIFGSPDEAKAKFDRIEKYYRYIKPSKDSGWYGSVNVKYRDQIICRKQQIQ